MAYSSILIEKTLDNYSYGYTKQYVYCKIPGNYKVGEIVNIKLTEDMIYEA